MIHTLITIGLAGIGLAVVLIIGSWLLVALGALLFAVLRVLGDMPKVTAELSTELGSRFGALDRAIDRICPKWL